MPICRYCRSEITKKGRGSVLYHENCENAFVWGLMRIDKVKEELKAEKEKNKELESQLEKAAEEFKSFFENVRRIADVIDSGKVHIRFPSIWDWFTKPSESSKKRKVDE